MSFWLAYFLTEKEWFIFAPKSSVFASVYIAQSAIMVAPNAIGEKWKKWQQIILNLTPTQMTDLDRKLRDLILKSEGRNEPCEYCNNDASNCSVCEDAYSTELTLPRILMALGKTKLGNPLKSSGGLVTRLEVDCLVFYENNGGGEILFMWDLPLDAYGQSEECKTLLINLLSE